MASPQPVGGLSLRGVVVGLLTALAVLHLLVAVGRAHDWALEGATLAAAGLVYAVGAIVVALSSSPRHLGILAGWIVVAVAALVVTRTAGYPFGPYDGYAPSVSSYDVVVIGISLVALALLVSVLIVDVEVLGRSGWRFETLAPLAVVVAALPGLAATRWVDDASSLSGTGHAHSSSTLSFLNPPLTWEQREQLGREVARVREIALTHPTLSSAIEAGWSIAGRYARGAGLLVVDPRRDFREIAFDLDSPHGLVYASDDPTAPIVGVQYAQWRSADEQVSGFTGQADSWHLHTGTCVVKGPAGEYAIPWDEPSTGSGCQEVDGTRDDTVSYMIRAWVVPGWENPYGTFAHDHPDLP